MDFTIPEELKQIQMLVRRFVREQLVPIEDMVEDRSQFPDEIRKPLIMRAIELGIRNMGVSEKYGGVGWGGGGGGGGAFRSAGSSVGQ